MSSRDMVTGLAIGVIVGAAAGAIVGLLYAPRPGREIREMLKTKADDIAMMARDMTVDHERVYKDIWEERGAHARPGSRSVLTD